MAAVMMGSWAFASDPVVPTITPDEALNRLKAGNERFVSSKDSTSKPVAARRAETAAGQNPFAPGCRVRRFADGP